MRKVFFVLSSRPVNIYFIKDANNDLNNVATQLSNAKINQNGE